MNFCTKCGAKLNKGAQFCSGCGAAVAGIAPNLNTTQDAVPYNPPEAVPYAPPSAVSYTPPQVSPHLNQQINIVVPPHAPPKVWGQTARLIIGLATLVLFLLLQVQSCVAMGMDFADGLLTGEQHDTGLLGYISSFFFLIAGIVSIAARKSRSGAVIAGGIYVFCGAGIMGADFSRFHDLAIYAFLSFAFAGILIIGAIVAAVRK